MSKVVIVARYREDVNWCNKLTCDKIIYNKFFREGTILPNIGREAHSYLTYIVNHYEDLYDLNVFTQGDPIFHSAHFIEKVNNLSDDTNFVGLSDLYWETDCYGLPYHPKPLKIKEYCEELLGLTTPEKWWFNGNAIFAVNKKLILRHNLSFYKNLIKLIDKDENLPWILERLWEPIFKGFFPNNKMYL